MFSGPLFFLTVFLYLYLFSLFFWRTPVLFVEPLLPLFWTSVTYALSFKARVDLFFACFVTCMQWIAHIHLWCATCWPLGSQHGCQAVFDPRTWIYFYHGFYLFLSLGKRHKPQKHSPFITVIGTRRKHHQYLTLQQDGPFSSVRFMLHVFNSHTELFFSCLVNKTKCNHQLTYLKQKKKNSVCRIHTFLLHFATVKNISSWYSIHDFLT